MSQCYVTVEFFIRLGVVLGIVFGATFFFRKISCVNLSLQVRCTPLLSSHSFCCVDQAFCTTKSFTLDFVSDAGNN